MTYLKRRERVPYADKKKQQDSHHLNSVTRLSSRLVKEKEKNPEATLSFDKDDEDAMKFVTAASNLRAHIFHIPTKSLFDAKCKTNMNSKMIKQPFKLYTCVI